VSLTPDQIARIRASFAATVPITDAVAARFYGRLFNLAPATRALFPRDLTEQGRKLFQTLAAVVQHLDDLDRITPAVRDLGVRHAGYGAQPLHYQAVGAALLDTLRGTLGPAFDHATEDAWAEAYDLLATVMQAGAAEQR
jgi:nitric oxide dioxygenase